VIHFDRDLITRSARARDVGLPKREYIATDVVGGFFEGGLTICGTSTVFAYQYCSYRQCCHTCRH
jgi:hypothetical protein